MITVYLLLIGITVVFFEWKKHRLSVLRRELFNQRNELFLIWGKSGRSFDENAYRYMETYLNSLIRYSNRISVTRVLVFKFLVFLNFSGYTVKSRFLTELYKTVEAERDEIMKQKFECIFMQVDISIINYLKFTKLIVGFLYLIVTILDYIIKSIRSVANSFGIIFKSSTLVTQLVKNSLIKTIEANANDVNGSFLVRA